MKISIRAGHNEEAVGAVGIMDEVVENRILLPLVIDYLKLDGQEVLDVTPGRCDTNTDLNYGVTKANEWGADLFVSLHFNKAYNSYNGAIGSEVCVYSTFTTAQRVCDKLGSLGFINRGQKVRPELYELRNTTMDAMIIETCFLEATDDVALYRSLGPSKVAKAIAEGIVGRAIADKPSTSTSTPSGELYRVRKSWDDASSQIGAYSSLENAKNSCIDGYSVFDSNGNCVYSKNQTSYTVKITADVLNVRSGAGTNYNVTTTVKQNEVYTIVETQGNWGKLKSGAGWICLDYTVKC